MSKTEKRLLAALRDFIFETIAPKEPQEKRVKTPYMMFCCDKRQEISEALAKIDGGGDVQRVRSANVTRKLAELWSKLSDEEKTVYIQRTMDEKAARKQATSALPPEGGQEVSTEEVKTEEKTIVVFRKFSRGNQ